MRLPGRSLHWINTVWASASWGGWLSGRLGYYLTWRWARVRCFYWAWEIREHSSLQGTGSRDCLWWDYSATGWLNESTHIRLGSDGITPGESGVQQLLCTISMLKCIKTIFMLWSYLLNICLSSCTIYHSPRIYVNETAMRTMWSWRHPDGVL